MWGQEVNNAVNPEMETADLRLHVVVRLSEEDHSRIYISTLTNHSEERCSRTLNSSIAGGTRG